MRAFTDEDGVYMSNSSVHSLVYSACCPHQYRYENNQFPKQLIVMALVENIWSGLLENGAPASRHRETWTGSS
jgi:hypothetical protein